MPLHSTPPPKPVPVIAEGQAETLELARLRAIRALLLSYGATVESTFHEKTSYKKSEVWEAHLVQVNVNSFHGIHILKEQQVGNTWTVSVELNEGEAYQYVKKSLKGHFEALQRLRNLPVNTFRRRAAERLEEQIAHETECLRLLKSRSDLLR